MPAVTYSSWMIHVTVYHLRRMNSCLFLALDYAPLSLDYCMHGFVFIGLFNMFLFSQALLRYLKRQYSYRCSEMGGVDGENNR